MKFEFASTSMLRLLLVIGVGVFGCVDQDIPHEPPHPLSFIPLDDSPFLLSSNQKADQLTLRYVVRNELNVPVDVTAIGTSCGCMEFTLTGDARIAAQDEVEAKAKFKKALQEGRNTQRIMLEALPAGGKPIRVEHPVSVKCFCRMRLEPTYLFCELPHGANNAQTELDIRARYEQSDQSNGTDTPKFTGLPPELTFVGCEEVGTLQLAANIMERHWKARFQISASPRIDSGVAGNFLVAANSESREIAYRLYRSTGITSVPSKIHIIHNASVTEARRRVVLRARDSELFRILL